MKEIIPENNEILKKILVLPVLPPEKIDEGFDVISNLVEDKFCNDENKLKTWRTFLLYIQNEWYKKVKPEVVSVFNQVDRTNNYLESYHRTLNDKIRTKPSVHNFICKFLQNYVLKKFIT